MVFSKFSLCPVAHESDLHELIPQTPLHLANGKHKQEMRGWEERPPGCLCSVHTGLAWAVASFFGHDHSSFWSTSLRCCNAGRFPPLPCSGQGLPGYLLQLVGISQSHFAPFIPFLEEHFRCIALSRRPRLIQTQLPWTQRCSCPQP